MTEQERRDLYIQWRQEFLQENGIDLEIVDRQYLSTGNYPARGYFDEDERIIRIAAGGDPAYWFAVFVHECCHADQYLSDCEAWRNCYDSKGSDLYGHFDEWVSRERSLTEEQIFQYSQIKIALELDCEKRAVDQIANFSLPIDTGVYIQRANAYLYLQNMFIIWRKHQKPNTHPSDIPEIYTRLPKHFVDDYTNVPLDYYLACERHCFK